MNLLTGASLLALAKSIYYWKVHGNMETFLYIPLRYKSSIKNAVQRDTVTSYEQTN